MNVRKNSNRTFQKYQINKSNSIQEAENSLQRLNGKLNDKNKLIINKNLINFFFFLLDIENASTSAKQISFHSKFLLLILSSNIIYNLIF